MTTQIINGFEYELTEEKTEKIIRQIDADEIPFLVRNVACSAWSFPPESFETKVTYKAMDYFISKKTFDILILPQ